MNLTRAPRPLSDKGYSNSRPKDFECCDVWTRSKAQTWRPILEAWICCTKTYTSYADDLSYSHIERANVGVLAAAAWRANWVALEEYSGPKVTGRGRQRTGRVDLFLANGKGLNLIIEAKKYWWRAHDKQQQRRQEIKREIKEACAEALRNRDTVLRGTKLPFGAVFVVMQLPKRDPIGVPWEKRMSRFKLDLRSVGADAIAFCFPRFGPRISSQDWTREWPGTALLLRAAD